jgi:hypothetical protein
MFNFVFLNLSEMEEILKRNGWRKYSSCSCAGTTEKKFINQRFSGIKICIYPTLKKWVVKQNHRDTGHGGVSNFNEKMVEYGYIKSVASGGQDVETQSVAAGNQDVETQPQAGC